jgi:RNA-directed DNA polymerase
VDEKDELPQPIPKVGWPRVQFDGRVPTFEGKVAQRAIVMVLEAIYEQDFFTVLLWLPTATLGTRGAAQIARRHLVASTALGAGCRHTQVLHSIPHSQLRAFLDQRVTDGVIRRMIDKWLKAGVLEDGLLRLATEGTPQGGVISPMLSNIFLHHVLDEWHENEVRPRLVGKGTLVRFADDFVMTFENHRDAQRVLEVLGKRLARHGLTLHPDKTRFIDFRPERKGGTHPDCAEPPFDFLGFTHHWAKSQKGRNVVRQTTAKSRLARALVAVKEWCRANRHLPILDQHKRLSEKLLGHYAYYAITGNTRQLHNYAGQTTRTWRKWLERRSRSDTLSWEKFRALLARHLLPRPRIIHQYAVVSQSLS